MRAPITHVSVEDPANRWGGIGTSVGLMAEASGELGISTYSTYPSAYPQPEDSHGVRFLPIWPQQFVGAGALYNAPARQDAGDHLSDQFLSRLEAAGLVGACDVIVHNEELVKLIATRAVRGDRVLYYSHGLSAQEHPDDVGLMDLQRAISRLGVPIAVVSRAQAEAFQTRLGVTPHVVRPPLQLLIRQVAQLTWRPPTDSTTIFSAGRCVRQKGFDLLIRATAEISRAGPSPVRLVLCIGHGDANYEQECRQLAEQLAAPVEWLPWARHDELLARMAVSTMLAMPSRFEPLGMLAAEAIAIGVPVVGTSVGGLAELLESSNETIVNLEDGAQGINTLARALVDTAKSPPTGRSEDRLSSWSSANYLKDLERCWQ